MFNQLHFKDSFVSHTHVEVIKVIEGDVNIV